MYYFVLKYASQLLTYVIVCLNIHCRKTMELHIDNVLNKEVQYVIYKIENK